MLPQLTQALRRLAGRSPRPTANARKKKRGLLLEPLEARTVPAFLAVTPQEPPVDLGPSDNALVPGPAPASQPASGSAHAVASPSADLAQTFRRETRDSFQDAVKFHDLMRTVYGDTYDQTAAEQDRQLALSGDDGFLPQVQFVDRETLHGGNGAYSAGEGVVYLADDLQRDLFLLRQAYVEEVGHHLDARLNKADTPGDEGELFRRVVSGEKLSEAQLAAVRAENDHGVIAVNGREIDVEFWSLKKALKKAAKGITNAAKSVADGVKDVVGGAVNAVGTVGKALGNDLVGGVFGNLVKGRVGAAFTSAVNAVDKIAFAAPAQVVNGVLDGAEKIVKAPTHLLPGKAGSIARDVLSRVADVPRSAFHLTNQTGRALFRAPLESARDLTRDLGGAAKLALRGDFGKAGIALAGSGLNVVRDAAGAVVDLGAISAKGISDVAGDVLFLHKPSRALTAQEKSFLEKVYGGKVEGSIDLDAIRIHENDLFLQVQGRPRAHVVGNHVYLPTKFPFTDGAGNLTREYAALLAHEVAHVWQSQNGGNDYIHDALAAQQAHAKTGGDAYEYVRDFKDGVSFDRMNREQQASVIEDIGEVVIRTGVRLIDVTAGNDATRAAVRAELEIALGDRNGNGVLDTSGGEKKVTLSDAEFKRLIDVWADVQAGRGLGSRANVLRLPLRHDRLSIPASGAGLVASLSPAKTTAAPFAVGPAIGAQLNAARK